MIYLCLSIVTGTWIAVVFKVIHMKQVRVNQILCANYMIATILTGGYYLWNHKLEKCRLVNTGFITLWHECPSGVVLLITGIILGLFMRINLICTEKSTVVNGVGSTTFFNRIGFFPCILVTIVLWKEIPSSAQIIGLILVVISMLEMVRSFHDVNVKKISMVWMLVGSTAMIELMNRIFSKYFIKDQKPLFLLSAFLSALIVSLTVLYKKKEFRKIITQEELILGATLGVPNAMNNFLKLKSLETLSPTTVFASFAVGTMVLSTIVGTVVYRERLNKKAMFSIFLAIISIVLVNL